MRITDLLDLRSICLDGAPGNKNEALDQMVALMAKSGKIKDEEGYRKQVYAREEESTTGIGEGSAHTYMAAEGIEKAAKAHDCFVKVETRGSGGAKNVLTDKEIAEADCIIVAADAQVPMSRFEGKKVIIRQASLAHWLQVL